MACSSKLYICTISIWSSVGGIHELYLSLVLLPRPSSFDERTYDRRLMQCVLVHSREDG